MHDISKLFNTSEYTQEGDVFYFGVPVDRASEIPRGEGTFVLDKTNWSPWRNANYSFFEDVLSEIKGGTLLDLGAGRQQFRDLTKRFSVCAVDAVADPGINVVCDLNKNLPFKTEIFDVVFLSNVLEHLQNPTGVASEAYRVLKPGGLIVGTVPFLMPSHQRPHDYLRYTDIYLSHMLDITGFTQITVKPVGLSIHVLMSMQHKFYGTIPPTLKTRILKRLLRKVSFINVWLHHKAFGSISSTPSYTEGYGFVGIK